MWLNAPPWMIICRDMILFLTGVSGMGYLILHDSTNIVLILVCLFLTGAPGVASFMSIIALRGRVTDSPPDTTRSSSPSQSSP